MAAAFLCAEGPAAFRRPWRSEDSEEFGSWKHFSDQQYELVSLVLQSCGQRRGESRELKPGEYLAGQAAVWGILTGYWESTDQLRSKWKCCMNMWEIGMNGRLQN